MHTDSYDYLLTIAIPTYNRKNLLKRALDSIIPQLNSNVEVLVSDNASNDGTDKMMTSCYPMVRYLKNEVNKGSDYNFLQCYKEARGKYVILLGSDDRLASGALNYLTDFLIKNNCDLTFVNFRFYDVTKKEIYIKNGEWIKNYDKKDDVITTDGSVFMKYANHSITFMSASIIKRSLLASVREPERFFGTYFLHTCLMFEALKSIHPKFGVVMQPFIEANATKGDSEMSKAPERAISVFSRYMYSVLCVHAVECGFPNQLMRKVYLQYLHDCPAWKLILSLKYQNNMKAIQIFWKDVYPIVKTYPLERIKVLLAAKIPRCVISLIYSIYYAIKKYK